jgi:bifunctional DNA-binding transcriptional regulator/antitoxin component of YhaV-PrlF toxin-antitoxin module
MKTRISIDRFGRLVLPKQIRRAMGLAGPAVFNAELVGNQLELQVVEPGQVQLQRKGKLLVVSRQGTVLDAVKGVLETRTDRL